MSKRKSTIFSTKPNEMEAQISYQAMRLTWLIINIAFIVLAIYFFTNGGVNPLSLLALVAAQIIYHLIYFILKWNMTHGGKDNQ